MSEMNHFSNPRMQGREQKNGVTDYAACGANFYDYVEFELLRSYSTDSKTESNLQI